MLLRAGLLLAFLSVAQAQAPRSAVLAALAPSATDVVPIAELIRGFDPAARTRALETLDKLDRASLFGPDLAELSEAYRLLGRMDRVAETASLIAQRGGGPDGSAGAILALAQSGDYGAAQKAAEAALKKNPNDTNLLAAYHQVKNRSSGKPPAAPAAAKGVELRESSAANDPRPYVLRVSMPKSDSKTSGVESLSLSGGDTEEEATLWDRLAAFVTPDDKLIEEDVSLMRRKALTFDLPPDIKSLATTNPEVPRQFAAWLKTARPEDLPPIEYGIVDPGDFAEFHRGIGRGKIVMSHLIRDAEPEARATALMHEVFHFWDMKIAKNPYQTESYGHTSAENRADREYDPYLVTAHFWQHIRPEKRISPLSSSLDRLPTEGDEVRRKVDALMRHKEKAGR